MPVDTPKIVKHQGTQTSGAGIDDIDEQIASYLELAVENDELLRSLISVKVLNMSMPCVITNVKNYLNSCCSITIIIFTLFFTRWTMQCWRMKSMPYANTIIHWSNAF